MQNRMWGLFGPFDELTADVVSSGQVGDRCRSRQRQNGQINIARLRVAWLPGKRMDSWVNTVQVKG